MTINWYGQACFRLESKDTSILIDPFSRDIGLKPPRLNDDIFLVTHEHYDHNNVGDAPSESFIIRGPGEYEKAGVYVEGIKSFHDNVQGRQRGLNTIYIIRFDDLRICHLGDLGQLELSDEQVEAIDEIDILMIPVGGVYTIDGAQAVKIINQIEPKIIIPMHYKVPASLNIHLEGPQKFFREIGLKPEEVEMLRIVKKNLPAEEVKLVTFKL